jgi:hypothetical protein
MTINDFVLDEDVKFTTDSGEFTYKKLSVKRELSMDAKYFVIKEELDMQLYALYKVAFGLSAIPYNKETINSVISVDKEWSELSMDDKLQLLNKMSSAVFAEITVAIAKIETSSEDLKKKL